MGRTDGGIDARVGASRADLLVLRRVLRLVDDRRREGIAASLIVFLLLGVCAARGVLLNAGLSVPPDEDIVRDLGFIQGFLNGDWPADPTNAGAWHWYPPLFHAIAAAAIWLTGSDLMSTWIQAGTWLNLASPQCFYLMNVRLIGRWPAVTATAVLVLAGGAVMRADEVAGYAPLTLTPALGWPVFYLGVWLIVARAPTLRWRDAGGIGILLGFTFLGHTVPAILLSVIVTAVVVATRGFVLRAFVWLAAVAAIELGLGGAFLWPLLVEYRLHIANPVPGAWVHDLLRPDAIGRFLWLNLPWLLTLPLLLTLTRAAATAVIAWIAVCATFLARHYICMDMDGPVCSLLRIAPIHYHMYLQAAWASLIGLTLWRGLALLPWRMATGAAAAAALAGVVAVFAFDPNAWRRDRAIRDPDAIIDRAAYRWLLRETNPRDLFVIVLPAEPDQLGSSAATVFAAGRRLVAPPEVHSNPYLTWPPMNARRLAFLDASAATPCRFAAYAGPGASASYLLPLHHPAPAGRLVLRTTQHALYRVDPAQCEPPM